MHDSTPHISIKAEPIFEFFGLTVTNSMVLSFVVLTFFLWLAVTYRSQASRIHKGRLFYFVTFSMKSVYSLFDSVLGKHTSYFFPLLGSLFFFILLQNWFGLLPGVGSLLVGVEDHGHIELVPLFRANTADLNTTLALAIITMILVQIFGVRYLGAKEYLAKFINFANPLKFFVGILEIVSEISRVISFSFRLFGNIFAGEVLIAVIAFLVPWVVSAPFLLLEVFVGLVQALVFAMLSAAFIQLAITKHH